MKTEDNIRKIAKINSDELLLLSLREDFTKAIFSLRKEIGIPKSGFKNSEGVKKLYEDEEKALLVTEATRSILKDFNISKNYEMTIILYLLYNKLNRTPLNYSIDFKDDYISVGIHKRPTKAEWVLIKNSVNSILKAIESKEFNFLKKFNYPGGAKISRPKRNIKRDLKIVKKSKMLGKKISTVNEIDLSDKYSDSDIEADVFPEKSIKQSQRNVSNIRQIRSRFNRNIKRTS